MEVICDLSGFNQNQINEIRNITAKQPEITAIEIYEILFNL